MNITKECDAAGEGGALVGRSHGSGARLRTGCLGWYRAGTSGFLIRVSISGWTPTGKSNSTCRYYDSFCSASLIKTHHTSGYSSSRYNRLIMDMLMYPVRYVTSMKKRSRGLFRFGILLAAFFLVGVFVLPVGAALIPVKATAKVVTDSCANKKPVADFSYEVISDNPLRIELTDKSTCADRWQWTVFRESLFNTVFQSFIIKDPGMKNVVVSLPSSGNYIILLDAGRNCNSCTDLQSQLLEVCCSENLGAKMLQVTINPSPATTQTTQPHRLVLTTQIVTTPQTTFQQAQPTAYASAPAPASAVTERTTAQTTAVIPSFTPSPSGQGPGTPGTISITSGAIAVNTSPPGAEISIDNEIKGASPALIPGLSPGTHSLMLRKPGYQNISTTFIIDAGQTREYSIGLIPATARTPGFTASFAAGGLFVLFITRRLFR
jgi:hypothetical protein